jgi:PAS domain S-box-containing protein
MTRTRNPTRTEFQRLLQSMPHAVAWVANDRTHLFANRAYAAQFGRRPEGLVGRHLRSVFGDAAYASAERHIEAALGGASAAFDLALGEGAGETVIDTEYMPNRTDGGEIDGFFICVRDVTEPKRQESALKESETRYAALFEKMLDGCAVHEIICDGNGDPVDYRFTDVNPAFQEITGLSRDVVIGKTVREVLPETESHWFKAYGDVALTGEPARFENSAQALGKVFDVLAFSTQPGTFAVIFRDITEENRVELERIVERSPAVSFLWRNEEEWPVDFVSKNIALYGYSPDDFLTGKVKFADVVHPDDLERVVDEVAAYSAGPDDEFSQEYRLKTASGKYIWIEDHTWIRRAADGAITHYQGILLDVTGKKEAERRLKLAMDEAEAANRAKSEFLAAMSHDLRTPLNAIMGFSEMIRTHAFGPLGEEHYEEYAQDIHRSGTLLISLINDILDLSKIEAEKYIVNEVILDVRQLVEESVNQNRAAMNKPAQVFSIDAAADLPDLRADERAVLQILNNLVSNAIKFSSDDGAIGIGVGTDAENAIVIAVADDGIGMSEADLESIRKPFAQANGEHARRHEGTGLGLYLVGNLMKLHGGTMRVSSEPGKGTTVTVRFPPARTANTAGQHGPHLGG